MIVSTFNIKHSGSDSSDIGSDIKSFINEHNIDVLGIQEINFKTFNIIKKIIPEFYCNYKNGPGGYCIFSKFQIIRILHEKNNYGNIIEVNYDNKIVKIINLHLHKHFNGSIPFGYNLLWKYNLKQTLNIIKKTQLSLIYDFFKKINKEDNIIIMGDFNNPSHLVDSIDWPVSKYLYSKGLKDTYNEQNSKTNSYLYDKKNLQIDYIYTNMKFEKSYFSFKSNNFEWFSDHKSLITKIV